MVKIWGVSCAGYETKIERALPNGAGFANSFHSEHLSILEFMSDNWKKNYYKKLSEALGFDHHSMLYPSSIDGSIDVDVSELEQRMEEIISRMKCL